MASPTPLALAVAATDDPTPSLEMAVTAAALAADELAWLKSGDSVFLKLAANSPYPYPATTAPAAVSALVRLLKERGAGRVVVGDQPGVAHVYQDQQTWRGRGLEVLEHNGLAAAAREAGAEVHAFDQAGWEAFHPESLEGPNHWPGPLMLPNILNEMDHLVLLPRVSRHVLAGATLGLKLGVGWLRDDSRLDLHQDGRGFQARIAELNWLPSLRAKTRLCLSLAHRVQTTFGPDQGHVVAPDPGLVIASPDLLAHDLAALGWLLWCRQHHTPAAELIRLKDPYQLWPGFFNRMFVGRVWGVGALAGSSSYVGHEAQAPHQDRVLARAAELRGGWPEVDLRIAGQAPPAAVLDHLRRACQPPPAETQAAAA